MRTPRRRVSKSSGGSSTRISSTSPLPHTLKGRVTASPHLAIRSKPTTKSFREGYYNKGNVLALKCSVKGQGVFGNTTWYRLDPTHNHNFDGVGYVSAHYIKLLGAKPHYC